MVNAFAVLVYVMFAVGVVPEHELLTVTAITYVPGITDASTDNAPVVPFNVIPEGKLAAAYVVVLVATILNVAAVPYTELDDWLLIVGVVIATTVAVTAVLVDDKQPVVVFLACA